MHAVTPEPHVNTWFSLLEIFKFWKIFNNSCLDLNVWLDIFIHSEKGKFKDVPIVEILLLKRKNIIHKASNKLEIFISIIKELINNNKNKYVFAYIPEGNTLNLEGDTVKILNQYLKKLLSLQIFFLIYKIFAW